MADTHTIDRTAPCSEDGFSLVEMMVAVTVLMIVSNTVFSGVLQMTNVSRSVSSRSEMHSGVRNANELLQQEIGQAGLISLPAPVVLAANVAAGVAVTTVSSAEGMFVGQYLAVGTGDSEETVQLTAVNLATNQIAATFLNAHVANSPVTVVGGFASGVVPPSAANGSTSSRLKLFGDINDDGAMVFIEYTCDTAGGNLYRNAMPIGTLVKPVVTVQQVLLNNIEPNPDGTPCFTYQQKTVNGTAFVVNVAVTLTARTQTRDPITGAFQRETKALLNVAPRNVYYVWQLASQSNTDRVQPTPPSVLLLLPS